jgi:hypothetical protein
MQYCGTCEYELGIRCKNCMTLTCHSCISVCISCDNELCANCYDYHRCGQGI